MYPVRYDVIQQPLIVGDDDRGTVRPAQSVDAACDDAQRVDIQARVSLVENGQLWLEDRHLEDLVPLLFSAGKAGVHRSAHDLRAPFHQLELLLEQIEEVHGVYFFQTVRLS